MTLVSRIVSALVLVLGGIAAYLMRDISVDRAWKMLAALGAGSGAVFMLRWFWWRINAWTEIVAMVSSFIYYQLLNVWVDHTTKQQQAGELLAGSWQELALPELRRAEMQTLVVAAVTIVTWLAVTWLTPPEDEDVLVAFYRKVRPGGPGWAPIARLAQIGRASWSERG